MEFKRLITLKEIVWDGRKEGKNEGRKEGRKEGKRKKGKKNGKKESQELSSSVALLSTACLYGIFAPLWPHFTSKVKKYETTEMKISIFNQAVVLTHITSLPGHWQTMSPPLIRYFHIFLHTKGKYRIHQNEESNLASRVIDECFQATGSTNHRLVDKGSQWNHHLYDMFTLMWQYVATIVTKCYTAEICRQKWGHIVNRINLDLTHRDELSQPQIVLTYTKHGLLGIANKKNYLLYVYIILLWPYFDSKVTKNTI